MEDILNLFFPKLCVGCKKPGGYICASCKLKILQSELVCPICERPAIGGTTHPLCRRRGGLDGLWSLGVYSGALKSLIHKLKYRFVREIAAVLVELTLYYWARYQPLFLEQIKQTAGKDWVMVPVPLYKTRYNWRGFNQTELIAKTIAYQIGIEYADGLERTRSTKTQVGLLSGDRRRNIKGAFRIQNQSAVLDKNILLWDDVWTTGSTLKECGLVLKRAGAKKVWAITLAR